MFDAIKRWSNKSSALAAERRVLTAWAKNEGHTAKAVAGSSHGLVVESKADWRLEWGPTQRPYFEAQELRFRCDTGLSPDAQMIFMTKALAHKLETDVFQSFTDATQTRVDNTLPDEMRWLAMHPRLALPERSLLSRRFVLLSNNQALVTQWLDADMIAALEEAAAAWWTDNVVMLMTLNRGLLTIRMPGEAIEINQLKLVGQLFGMAAKRMRSLV